MSISHQIWESKYQFKRGNEIIDHTIEDTWRRVAHALSVNEPEYQQDFYNALEDFKFIPAGRILAGAGTSRNVTLFNCYVMGDIGDSLQDIFSHLKEAALTMQQGGGIGYDFSTLRPKGALVQGVDADASGPLSFMDVWNSMCQTIMSAGARRGAMMATMRCDHPDIEDFIKAKRQIGRLTNFNLSVLITDNFMAAVRDDSDWELKFNGTIYKVIKAKALFDTITRATYDYAEPGVIFIDRINERNNLKYCEEIHSTNPCGEQPLPAYGACLLGSINMTKLVIDPFTPRARVDEGLLASLVTIAVRMLDNTIDVSNFPLDAQRIEAQNKRRIGLGMTGLADALIMMRVTYGTVDAVGLAKRWAQLIEAAAYTSSAKLAKEKGSFPLYDEFYFLSGYQAKVLDSRVYDRIKKNGMRNSHLTSIAPTGTISLVADNVSSGIEPVFALSYTRKVLQPDGSKTEEEVSSYSLRKFRELFGKDEPLPDYFVTAQELTPQAHIDMQAAVQRHIDSAISKTVNVPKDISFEDFQEVYLNAYISGCKGCTTYRPNDITGSVLEVKPAIDPVVAVIPELIVRPDQLIGSTYKLKWEDHALYITINDLNGAPLEMFINSKNLEHYSWVVALTRMISAVFRRGGDVSFVAEELKQVFDPRGGQWSKGKYVPSLVAAIGDVLEQHMGISMNLTQSTGEFCPKCNQSGLTRQSGCFNCVSCGWSKCG